MLTLDEVKSRLEDCNLKAVSEKAGVHYNALYRMMRGGTHPAYETVKKLSDYLEARDAT